MELQVKISFMKQSKLIVQFFDNLETKGVKLDDWLDDIDFHFNNKYKTQYINILEW